VRRGSAKTVVRIRRIREETIRFVALTTAKRANRARIDSEGWILSGTGTRRRGLFDEAGSVIIQSEVVITERADGRDFNLKMSLQTAEEHNNGESVRDGSVHGRKTVEQGSVCVHVLTHALVANVWKDVQYWKRDMRVAKVDEAYRSLSLKISSAGSLRWETTTLRGLLPRPLMMMAAAFLRARRILQDWQGNWRRALNSVEGGTRREFLGLNWVRNALVLENSLEAAEP
jgi:hypothetical protein